MGHVAESRLGPVFGRLIIVSALVWAVTMLGVAVVMKVSDDFMWAVFVLLAGWMLSGAAIESARRSLVETRHPT